MTTFNIDMKEDICSMCKKKEWVAPNGMCLGCTTLYLKTRRLQK